MMLLYFTALYQSWVGKELYSVRNSHSAFKYGTLVGLVYTAFTCFLSNGKEPWTLHNTTKDSEKTLRATECEEIQYPKADGKLSFDLLTNLQRSGMIDVICVYIEVTKIICSMT